MHKLLTAFTLSAAVLVSANANAGPLAKFKPQDRAAVAAMIVVHKMKCDEPQSPQVQYLLMLIRTEKNTYSEVQSLAALLDVQTQINNVGIDRWCERVTDSFDSITAKFK